MGWKDWKRTAQARQLAAYVGRLARIRKEWPILRSPRPFQLQDYENRGCPDLSYHSDGAWKIDFGMNRGFVGMFYSGAYAGMEKSLYAAYNFQSVPQKFALPGGMEWELLLDTAKDEAILDVPEKLTDVRELLVDRQSVCLLSGKTYSEGKAARRRRRIEKISKKGKESKDGRA